MEYLMELSEDGVPTGRLVSREEAHAKGVLHGTSQIFIYRYKNDGLEILLQRRVADKDSFPNCLDISCAGHIPGEMTYTQNAVKELEEELGIKVKESDLQKLFFHKSEKKNIFYGKLFYDRQISMVYALKMDVNADKIKFQKEEISEVLWAKAEDILERTQSGAEDICIDHEKLERVIGYLKGKGI
ncbi:MAG: NUDIX domain-containing protein [Bacillota bacterium]|nr:NUDIX domain-containing protein [Bacillota bacterium]